MLSNSKTDICNSCGKSFKVTINTIPSKLDDKRESYYCCPHCHQVVGTLKLSANEEVCCKKI